MGKHTDALKSYEEFRAPWETEGGEDAEINKSKLKRFIYNLIGDKAKAQDAREEAVEKVTSLEAELETAKAEAADANGEEASKKIKKLEGQLAEAKAKVESLEKDQEIAELRAEVLEGVDPKHAKHVKGETREELEKSLKEIREDFGIPEPGENSDEEEEDDEPIVRTTPRSRLKSGTDPKNGAPGEAEIDFDKVANEALGNNIFG